MLSKDVSRRVARALLVVLAVSVLAATPSARAVSATEVAEVTFDLVVLRPLNAAAVVVGSVFFVASAPLVWPVEGLASSYEVFVAAPYQYTFERPLGEL